MPHMLGWFALRPDTDTSLEDAEWLLARAAGFDAGFALAASLASTAQLTADASSADTARTFGATVSILEAIKRWETARMSGAFPPAVKARLCANNREFHLEARGEGEWDLFEVHAARFTHDAGQSATTGLAFENPGPRQTLQWIVRSAGKEPLEGVVFEIDGRKVLDLKDATLPPGGGLRYTGGTTASIVDA